MHQVGIFLTGIALVLTPLQVHAKLGLDMSDPVKLGKTIQCFGDAKQNADKKTYEFVIPRVGSYGSAPVGYDSGATTTIRNALANGITHIEGYIYLCPKKIACGQHVENVVKQLRDANLLGSVSRLWMDVEGEQTKNNNCWYDSASDNVKHIQDAVAAAGSAKKSVGVYSSRYPWNYFTGSWKGLSHLPLWWPSPGPANFADYAAKSFGGWTKPLIRQYSLDTMLCQHKVDKNYYED